MSYTKCLVVFLAAVASVNGLVTGHVARHGVHHRSIAARVAEPQSDAVVIPALAKRAPTNSRKRCRPRPSSSSAVASPTSQVPPVNAAPVPSSSTQQQASPTTPPPSPTPTPQPSPTTTTQASGGGSGGSDSGPSFMRGTQTGEGTFYDTGLGACGITNKDTDYIAAVSHLLFDNYPGYTRGNPNNNPMCGRTVTARYNGKSVRVALTDRCEGCAVTDLDFSPAAFAQLADFGAGRIRGMTWTWD